MIKFSKNKCLYYIIEVHSMFKNSQKTHKAFSLAEILISLAIVGLVGAMMIVGITKATPNRNKVMFLKYY